MPIFCQALAMQAIECMAQSKDETCAYLCRLRRGRDRMTTKDFGANLLWGQLGVVDHGGGPPRHIVWPLRGYRPLH